MVAAVGDVTPSIAIDLLGSGVESQIRDHEASWCVVVSGEMYVFESRHVVSHHSVGTAPSLFESRYHGVPVLSGMSHAPLGAAVQAHYWAF